jgi:DNA replicative helicase MCM subunit Mcm2 (Cdc46/Mcm family)
MVNKDNWDADERNKQNDLRRYLDSLTRHQQQMIKGIVGRNAFKYLSLEEKDFLKQLQDSLTLNELSKLSKEETRFRDRLIEDIMAVWRRNKAILEEYDKDHKRDQDEREKRAAEGWAPRHRDPLSIDRNKIYSVTEASRLHEGRNASVMGVISGIQPMRKMIKGVSRKCNGCNEVWERKYDKPAFFESFVPIERIRKCEICKTGDYLGPFKWENINAVIVELKDHNTFSEIDPLRIIIFGDDEPEFDSTRDIDRHIGETIIVTGDIFTIDISRRRIETKMVAYLYVTGLVNYLSRQEIELTAEDVKAIRKFVDRIGPDKILDKLAEMFATPVIGNNYVKKGLLLCAASTTLDKTAKKLHAILVGDPGLAKSQLLKASVGLVPNSRYESVQFATAKSLTAIVTKEEGDTLTLRIGPIPQAKGALAALNEIGRMIPEDQGLMLDTMQEQEFTTNKFGQNFHVDAPTAIIASANPVGGSWKSYESEDTRIDLDKIPMIKPLIDRFDFIFPFKDSRDRDALEKYADQKADMEDRIIPDYTAYIVRHIMYAKQRCPKPRFSEEAKYLLNQYYVNIRASYGSPRILKTIFEIAKNIAKLKLKQEVDAADANEAMQFYNYILLQLNKVVSLPSNPRDVAYEECLNILRESRFPISFEEVIDLACNNNPQVNRYLGSRHKLRDNIKLRPILEMLQNNSRVKTVQMKPMVLQYIHDQPMVTSKAKADEQACDPCDPCDGQSDTSNKNKNNEKKYSSEVSEVSGEGSHASHTSHSVPPELEPSRPGPSLSDTSDTSDNILIDGPYAHLIDIRYLSSLGCRVYSCKEHPEAPEYYDLNGIMVSHFKAFHTQG